MSNILPFRVLYEEWGEVNLPDGNVIRYRPTLALVIDAGENQWTFRIQQQYQVNAPETLKRPVRPNTKRLGQVLGAVSQGSAHASYEIDGRTLHVKMVVTKVFRTDGYDQNGDPVFNIEHNNELRMHGGPEQTPPPAMA